MSFRRTQRLRNLNSGPVKPHESVLQLHHSRWCQDHVSKDFRPLASLGVTILDSYLARPPLRARLFGARANLGLGRNLPPEISNR